MAFSISKRVAVAIVAVGSVTALGACEIPISGGSADASSANPNNTFLARGIELPDQGIQAGKKSVRGAHDLVAIDPPGDEDIETADIAPPTKQSSEIGGNPASLNSVDVIELAEEIVRSIKNN